MDNDFCIKQLEMNHIKMIIQALGNSDINRSEDYFNLCLLENELNKRITLVAFCGTEFAGYINILFHSKYPFFYKNQIPEISDFFVLEKFREKGIGTKLLQAAEKLILKNYGRIGLGVGLYKDFGPVQKLYVSNGYLPEHNNSSTKKSASEYERYARFDDDFVVYLYKELK